MNGIKKRKTYRRLEGTVRGFANHRRIEILMLLSKQPGLSVFEVAELLNVNYKTVSEHLRRLLIAGLIDKYAQKRAVRHKLTELGLVILKFLRRLE